MDEDPILVSPKFPCSFVPFRRARSFCAAPGLIPPHSRGQGWRQLRITFRPRDFAVSGFAGHFSVGASGAILGLVGLLIAITSKRGGMQMRELRSRLISWVITIFAIGFLFGGLRTDHWAHAGGLTAGYVLGKVFVDRQPMNGSEKTRAYALGWIAGIVAIASFLFMVLNYSDPIPRWIYGAQ